MGLDGFLPAWWVADGAHLGARLLPCLLQECSLALASVAQLSPSEGLYFGGVKSSGATQVRLVVSPI